MDVLKQMGLAWKNPFTIEEVEHYLQKNNVVYEEIGKKQIKMFIKQKGDVCFVIAEPKNVGEYFASKTFGCLPDDVKNSLTFAPSISGKHLMLNVKSIKEVEKQVKQLLDNGQITETEKIVQGFKLKRLFNKQEAQNELVSEIYNMLVKIVAEMFAVEVEKHSYELFLESLVKSFKEERRSKNGAGDKMGEPT